MNAKPVPLHCQLPAKYFSSFSFGFGPGGASAARADQAAKARTMIGKRIRFMQSLLSVVRSLARIHVADALAYLTRCTTARTTQRICDVIRNAYLDTPISATGSIRPTVE